MRIVVADPSRTTLKAVSRLLERDGHVVNCFVDGREALDFIKSNPEVEALITSAQLEFMSGLELCWETRLLSGHDRAIYIILMSSNSEKKDLINALDGGADEFIGKPPAGEELYARLRSAERLLRSQRGLIHLARVDPLTGLSNRRAFFEKAERACLQATSSQPSTAIMFDVDHFKRVNDTFGHDIGDQVLRAIGHAVAGERSLAGRLGGEEFAIVLEASTLEAGIAYAERLRATLAALSFETAQGKMSVTCSFGVAERQDGETIDQVLKRADAALYAAKSGGRNRVVAARPADVETGETQWSGLLRSDSRGAAGARDEAQRPASQTNLLSSRSSNA
jgi:diguanylate cyclase (GGDEF)-like protein